MQLSTREQPMGHVADHFAIMPPASRPAPGREACAMVMTTIAGHANELGWRSHRWTNLRSKELKQVGALAGTAM